MPRKFFPQRKSGRTIDTMSATQSYSFVGTRPRNANNANGAFFDIFGTATEPVEPVNELIAVKATDKRSSILFTELDIPNYSVILGGYIQLQTHPTNAPVDNGILFSTPFRSLDVALYPETGNDDSSDAWEWRGIRPTKAAVEAQWRHIPVKAKGVNNSDDAANFFMSIREGPLTVLGITASANTGVATNGLCACGRMITDENGTIKETVRSFGQVLTIDTSSSAVDRVLVRVRRVGTFSVDVNLVCKVYNYDATTKTKGGLRATSGTVSAAGLTTSNTLQTTFTFSSVFAVTAGENILVTIEPETSWNTANTAYIRGLYYDTLNYGSGGGANQAGSPEIIWWEPLNTGNSNAFFFYNRLPVVYATADGTAIEDPPYRNSVCTLPFDNPVLQANTIYKLRFTEAFCRNLQNYNIGQNDVKGALIALQTPDDYEYSVYWNAASNNNGIYVVYRSTRTFIT